MPSLNSLQPELVPHGVDMQIMARISGTGAFVELGEIYDMDYDEDQGMVKLPVLGSRRTGSRRGRFTCTGTIKAYWINSSVREMIVGTAPDGSPVPAAVYHSQTPFNRYDIQVTAKITGTPIFTFVNVTFSKDATRWAENNFAEETITFECEDVLAM